MARLLEEVRQGERAPYITMPIRPIGFMALPDCTTMSRAPNLRSHVVASVAGNHLVGEDGNR
jgi:hypothetical protein